MRTLFTVSLSHLDRKEHDDALAALADAMYAEFPAYRAYQWEKGDFAAAMFVTNTVEDAPIPALLNGWGHGSLTLKLVA